MDALCWNRGADLATQREQARRLIEHAAQPSVREELEEAVALGLA